MAGIEGLAQDLPADRVSWSKDLETATHLSGGDESQGVASALGVGLEWGWGGW